MAAKHKNKQSGFKENSPSQRSWVSRVLRGIARFTGWFLLGVVALVLIVLVGIQTTPAKKQIVRIAVNQVNKILEADISVAHLRGNFFNGLSLEDVALYSAGQDTIAFIEKIDLGYSLLPLLRGRIVVNKAVIENPYIHLEQLADSTWNVTHIVKPKEEPDTTTSTFNMHIKVRKFSLENGTVKIDAFQPNIPDLLQDLNLNLSGFYSREEQQVDIKDLNFTAFNPDIRLVELNLDAERDSSIIKLKDLLLQTAENKITAQGEYSPSGREKSTIELHTDPIILDEFKVFLPDSFRLGAKPVIDLHAELENKNLSADLTIKDNDQQIDLQAVTYQLLEFLSDSTVVPVTFDVKMDIDKVDIGYWLANSSLKYEINGLLTANGEGLDINTMRANATGDFSGLTVYDKKIQSLKLKLNYLAGNVDGFITGRGAFGSLDLTPRIRQLLGNNPGYNVYIVTRDLDASFFMGDKRYKTDVNMKASVTGSGFEFDRINAQTKILMDTSAVFGIRIDTLNSEINLVRKNFIVHGLFLEALNAQLRAEGNYNMRGTSDLTVNARVEDVRRISHVFGIENFDTNLELDAHLTGDVNDLNADLQLGIGRTHYQNINVDTISLMANAEIQNQKDINAKADLEISNFAINNFRLDSINLHLDTDVDKYNLDIRAENRDMQAQLNSIIQPGDAIRIDVADIYLNYKDYKWGQVSDSTYITITDTEYEIHDLHLISDSVGFTQSIYIDGLVSRTGEQDLTVQVENFDIKRLLEAFNNDQKIYGLIDLDVKLDGEAMSPHLLANLNVDSTMLNSYRFDSVMVNLELQNNELKANLNILPQDDGRITGEGTIPVSVRLDSMQFALAPDKTSVINAKLLIDQLQLEVLEAFFPADEMKGEINSELSISGALEKPTIEGNLRIDDGKVIIDQYGIKYNLIQTDIQVQTDGISVDTFLIQSDDGNMTANGNVKFNSALYNADINSSQLSIKFDNFNPLDHRQFNIELSGDIDVKAEADSTRFTGDITIPEAYIYLPAIMNLIGRFSTPNIPKPLLVQERERIEGDSLIYTFRPDTTATDTVKNRFRFLDNLQGQARVQIPRNTWIRNDDFRIELSGDVELIKHRDFFELFGTVDVVRGQYNLLGKVFVVKSGTVTFQGGEKIDPILDVQAQYSFRDDYRNKRELGINVTGDLENLDIKFDLDGDELNEGDALSYIVFGKTLDELTTSEQSGINASSLAGVAASSLLSSQASKLLGNTGLVDYIEVDVGSSFDSGSFTVGKYITNKLFVSYEQHIGTIEDKDIARYEMTLEYEIFRFLFAQLTSSPITSGFDLIFKLNSKMKE